MLISNLDELEKKYLDLSNRIENFLYNAPYEHLKVQKKNDSYYYYKCEPGDTNGVYLHKGNSKDEDLIDQLCLKQYYRQLLPVIKKDLAAIQSIKRRQSSKTIGTVYDELQDGIKAKISGVEYSDQEFLKRWISTPYASNPMPFTDGEYKTKKGDLVRSKSELIIADKLYDRGIPYKYEKKITFQQYGEFYPDFTVLNVRTRQVYIWEHFGRMGRSDYREKTYRKIAIFREFENSRAYKFIATFEEDSFVLGTKQIENLIENNFI